MARRIEAHDLELYAINTSEFYKTHLAMAEMLKPVGDWLAHVQYKVLPRYCKEIEPVTSSDTTKLDVARRLMGYYQRHVAESKALAKADLIEALSSLVAACEAMPFAQRPHGELEAAWKALKANQKDQDNV